MLWISFAQFHILVKKFLITASKLPFDETNGMYHSTPEENIPIGVFKIQIMDQDLG